MTLPTITKKAWLILGVLALFTVLLVIGTDLLLRRVPPAPAPDRKDALPPPSNERQNPPNDGNTHFINTVPPDPRAVIYTDAGFSTRSITIRASDPTGCAMTIKNETAKPVTIRVGPHNPKGEDPGFPYQSIAPQETTVLDARYPGLPSIAIHDHARPKFELTVNYGEGCR